MYLWPFDFAEDDPFAVPVEPGQSSLHRAPHAFRDECLSQDGDVPLLGEISDILEANVPAPAEIQVSGDAAVADPGHRIPFVRLRSGPGSSQE